MLNIESAEEIDRVEDHLAEVNIGYTFVHNQCDDLRRFVELYLLCSIVGGGGGASPEIVVTRETNVDRDRVPMATNELHAASM